MSLPEVVSREQWLKARLELLAAEKDLTRRRDAVNVQRRQLPMVRIDKKYVFEGPEGPATLPDLFGESSQLIVQHVMFDPAWDAACSGCTASVDELSDGLLANLRTRQTAFALVSRAPLEKLEAYRALRGWTVPWYSSFGSDFNYDFHVTLDGAVTPVEYNYRNLSELAAAGAGWMAEGPSEQPGLSCFLRDAGEVYHTYSTYARGTEQAGGAYYLLDMTALGRQEEWEEPSGRADILRGDARDW